MLSDWSNRMYGKPPTPPPPRLSIKTDGKPEIEAKPI